MHSSAFAIRCLIPSAASTRISRAGADVRPTIKPSSHVNVTCGMVSYASSEIRDELRMRTTVLRFPAHLTRDRLNGGRMIHDGRRLTTYQRSPEVMTLNATARLA